MRNLLCFLTLSFAACGGSAKHDATPSNHADIAARAAGNATGLEHFTWGESEDAVKAASPQATKNPDGGLWAMGTTNGISSLTVFKFGANGLASILIEWTEGFISMEDCAKHWKELRTGYDKSFGPSQADNLAAYWKTPTSSITLACNPNDSGAGVLSMSYAPPASGS